MRHGLTERIRDTLECKKGGAGGVCSVICLTTAGRTGYTRVIHQWKADV